MKISHIRLIEFQDAYRLDFNEEISIAEAHEMLSRLVMLYEVLIRPTPQEVAEQERLEQGRRTNDKPTLSDNPNHSHTDHAVI